MQQRELVSSIAIHYKDTNIIYCDGSIGISYENHNNGYTYEYFCMRTPIKHKWVKDNDSVKFESPVIYNDTNATQHYAKIILDYFN